MNLTLVAKSLIFSGLCAFWRILSIGAAKSRFFACSFALKALYLQCGMLRLLS